jgi:hypothetical protein
MARSYLNYGKRLLSPKVGCIVVFPRGSSPVSGHVGFVAEVRGDTLMVLGGNQNDAVKYYCKVCNAMIDKNNFEYTTALFDKPLCLNHQGTPYNGCCMRH